MIFPEHYVVDLLAQSFATNYRHFYTINPRRSYDVPSVGLYDDEMSNLPLKQKEVENLRLCSMITHSVQRYQELVGYGLNVAYYPFNDWLQILCPIVKWKEQIPERPQDGTMWNFLNRRWQPGRSHALEYITRDWETNESYSLLSKGYATANHIDHYKDHPALHFDKEFIDKYDDSQGELNVYEYKGMLYSANVANVWDIARKVPGKICIQIESFWEPDHSYSCFPTEKSLTPFLTKNIPILIQAKTGFIAELKGQGFDVFDDIVDHSYDQEPDYYKRIELAFELNRRVLTSDPVTLDIEDRLSANQQYVLGEWFEKQMVILKHNIDNLKNNL